MAAFLLPPRRLDIDQRPDTVRVTTAQGQRAFAPGDEDPHSVSDRYGSRMLRAGWVADAFTIISDGGGRLTVEERVRHVADDRLERTVKLKATGVKNVTVRAVYRRATTTDLALPMDEGPPQPER